MPRWVDMGGEAHRYQILQVGYPRGRGNYDEALRS